MDQIYYIFSKYYHDILSSTFNCNENNHLSDLLNKKFIHTFRVISNVKEICFYENIPERITYLSEISALFHDIGRFKQAIDFGHFNDSTSFNHALESAEIFKTHKSSLLNYMSNEEFDTIYNAIQYHNKLILPNNIPDDTLLISNILRDADKLSILSINLKSNFKSFDGTLPEAVKINKPCIDAIYSHSVIKNSDVLSIIDNNIKLLSWVYDFNFKQSIKIFLNEEFLEILTNSTHIQDPQTKEELDNIKNYLQHYLNKTL